MNKVTKFLVGAAVVAPFLMAGVASAATIPATTVFSGQTQVWGNAGQTVQATFRVNVAAGEVVHAIRTQVDSQPSVCTPVGPFEGAQNVDVPVSITLPPNGGAGYNLTADLFTTATVPQAQAMTGNLACTGSYTTAYSGSNVVNVLPVSGGTSGSTAVVGSADWMSQLIAALKAALMPATPAPAPVPTVDPLCTQLASAMTGAQYGIQTSGNVALQGFLLYQHESIPALAQGAAFGLWLNQTQAALAHFKSVNNCQ